MIKKPNARTAAFAVWTVLSCAVHILLFRGKVGMELPVLQRMLIAVVAVAFVLFVHEGIHLVFMKLFGLGKVKLIFAKDKLGVPTPGVLSERQGSKGQEIILRLAPFVFLTILPDILFAFCTGVSLFFFLVAIANCAGCFYDVMDVRAILKSKKA